LTVEWELDHVGIVVRNIDEATKYYKILGMEQLSSVESKVFENEVNNKKTENRSFTIKSCFIQNQTFRIELNQSISEGNIFQDYLNRYGEGVTVFNFRVDNLKQEKDRLVKLGVPVIAAVKRADGSDMEILFDTRRYGNIVMSLSSEPVSFPIFQPSEGKWRFDHLGLVVHDTDKLTEYYQSIGFKPLSPPREITFTKVQGWEIYGKMPAVPQVTKAVQFQNKQATFLLEVNQPGDDGSLHREFLENHGEGVNHIHFMVDDLEEEFEAMAAKGFPAILTARRPDGKLHESYYETRRIGGVCVALWGGPPPFRPKPE